MKNCNNFIFNSTKESTFSQRKKKKENKYLMHINCQFVAERNENRHSIGNFVFFQFMF